MGVSYSEQELTEKNLRLESQLDFLTKENQTLSNQVAQMKSDYARSEFLRRELDEKTLKINNLHQKNEEMQEELSTCKKKGQQFDMIIESMEKESRARLMDKEAEIEEVKQECFNLKEDVEKMRNENKTLMEKQNIAGILLFLQ